jgi:uncharacterized protein (DUF111 family)
MSIPVVVLSAVTCYYTSWAAMTTSLRCVWWPISHFAALTNGAITASKAPPVTLQSEKWTSPSATQALMINRCFVIAAFAAFRPVSRITQTEKTVIIHLDYSTGASGDKTLGALLELAEAQGVATLAELQKLVATLLPKAQARVCRARVTRGGITASYLTVEETTPPLRHWSEIRSAIQAAEAGGLLDRPTTALALSTFEAIAVAEAKVHGTQLERVHFHEIGAADSIVDIVGCCWLKQRLAPVALYATALALGSGTVSFSHGTLPVPAPATALLVVGLPVSTGLSLSAKAHVDGPPQDKGGHQRLKSGLPEAPTGEPLPRTTTSSPTAAEVPASERLPHDSTKTAADKEPTAPAGELATPTGELTTPTGAALARVLVDSFEPLPTMRLAAVGYGAGARELPGQPNVTRALLGRVVSVLGGVTTREADAKTLAESASLSEGGAIDPKDARDRRLSASLPENSAPQVRQAALTPNDTAKAWSAAIKEPSSLADRTLAKPLAIEQVVLLEANIDHRTPEALAFACEELLVAGALDVWQEPITMKKGRLAVRLSALVAGADATRLTREFIAQTGSLGVRATLVERVVAPRKHVLLDTSYGTIPFKATLLRNPGHNGDWLRPEHDAVARITREQALDYQQVYDELVKEARHAVLIGP